MNNRMILGLMLSVFLSACGDGSGSSAGSGGAAGAGSGSIAAVPASGSAQPLALAGTPPASFTVGVARSYRPTVTFSEGPVTFSITGLPSWATFDMATGEFTGTPSGSDVGTTADITITATDGTRTATIGPFVIHIFPDTPPAPAPTPPVISGTPSTTATTGQAYAFQAQASDAAGHALTFSISNRPAWATFSTATGKLSGTPTTAQAGTYPGIVIQVTDGTSSAALPTFTITVTAATVDTPVISGTPATSVTAGQAYRFQPTAGDPAGKALDFTVVQSPGWATFDAATGTLSGTPTVAQVGAYPNIVISASNGTASASLVAFTVTVTAPVTPDTPVISGAAATTVTAGHGYQFTPTASDPAGRALTFAITNKPNWATFSTTTGQLAGTPTTAQTGSYPSIGITASNGTASAALAAFGITVSAPAPVVTPSPTIAGSPGTTVSAGAGYAFTPSTTDPSGGTLTFTVTNLPAWATFDTATGELSGTPAAGNAGITAGIVISVSDGMHSASLAAFSITVTQAAVTYGSATLSWTAPTENTDGTPLTNLAGYLIYYGTSATSMTQSQQINDPTATTATIGGLSSGTWYFTLVAVNSVGAQSPVSGVASKTL